MKILFNNNVLSGLISFRSDVMEHFVKQGHDVIAVASLNNSTLLSRLPKGVRYIPVKLEYNKTNPFQDLSYIRQLFSILRRERPDYVFNYTAKANTYGTMVCKLLHIPSTAMLAGLGYCFIEKNIAARIGLLLHRIALRYSRHVMLLNNENVEYVKKIKLFDVKKLIWLQGGEGVSLKKYPFTDNTSDKTTFLFIARLLRDKGFFEFAEAAKIVKKVSPQTRFLVAGGYSPNLPNSISEQEVKPYTDEHIIEHLGNVSDMQALYAQPGIIVAIPSYFSEGLNRSLIEACSCGKPILTTDHPGCRETLKDGINGFFVKERDAQSLADAMLKCLNLTQEEKRQMSLESRKLAKERFDVENVIKIYDSIIKQDLAIS